jgi:lipid-A-disaccharide synthase
MSGSANVAVSKSALTAVMVAGEASGDMLAALLIEGMQTCWPNLRACGIGGPRMCALGFDAWWPSDKLSVRGYVEVARHYREIVGIRAQLKKRLYDSRPDVFIGVDAPDFNLDLERDLKAHGVKTVHFISPSIWAWRAERVEKIRQSVDHLLCVFPFEVDLLAQHGIAATYVGHPLADVIPMNPDKAQARAALNLNHDDLVVAVLPGSRRSEIQYLAQRFFQAVALIHKAQPATKFIVPAVPALRQLIEQAAHEAGVSGKLQILQGQSHAALAACDVTLIASGTATLEAALFKRPMVIAYNMHWLSWQIMRRKKLQPWVGLPNILCRGFEVPEFLQDAATPAALAGAVLDWFAAPAKIAALQQKFSALHAELRRDTPKLATDAIKKVLAG